MADLVYVPPGVTVAEDASPVPNIASAVAIPPSRIALVGPSIGYQTYTEPLLMTGVVPQTVTKNGVSTGSIVVSTLAGATLALTTDYTVSQTGSPAEESVTTITRVGGGAITDGQTVYVTYQYTDSAFYEPFLSSDWDQIQSRFGAAIVSTTGAIGSPLSLAAKVVMEQGVREMLLLPTKGSTPTSVTAAQINTAYTKLETRDDIGIVVPLGIGITGTDVAPGDTNSLVQNLKTHVESMSTAGLYRIGVVGLDTGATRDHTLLGPAIASRRVLLAYPNILSWYNGYTNTTIELGGCYLAAAMGGMLASRMPQEPLTKKRVSGFSSIPARVVSTMTKSAKDDLSNKGVAVAELVSGDALVVRHGTSTDRSSLLTREVSITRGKDTTIRLVYQALDQSGLIGTPVTADTPVRIRSIVEGALSQARSLGVIAEYSNLAVKIKENDPTSVVVKFAYIPAYPLNYITVSFSINTVTGSQTEV